MAGSWWEWVFDGIGAGVIVAVGTGLITFVWRRRQPSDPRAVRQRAKASKGSTVVQVGGDFSVEITPEAAEMIADALARRFIRGPSPLARPTPGRQTARRLGSAIADLPEANQAVLALYYGEKLAMPEIASLLKISAADVQQLHEEGLRLLAGPVLDSW